LFFQVGKIPPESPFEAIAVYLSGRLEAIMHKWRKAALSDPRLSPAKNLSRPQLDDHIPFILDNFVAMVRGENETCSTNAKSDADQNTRDHGLLRWQQGYELHQLTIEWGHLHLVLLEELESFPHAGVDPGSDVMARVRRLLAVLCTDGVSESAERYWRLHQAEASGQVRDLEATLKRVSVAEITRAESWREAAHDIRGTFGSVELATLLVDDPSSAQDRQENIELL
jgi:hypothetical protein